MKLNEAQETNERVPEVLSNFYRNYEEVLSPLEKQAVFHALTIVEKYVNQRPCLTTEIQKIEKLYQNEECGEEEVNIDFEDYSEPTKVGR